MGGINAVALSRDETTVLTVGQEKRITFWDLREHHPVLAKVTTAPARRLNRALLLFIRQSSEGGVHYFSLDDLA